MSHNVYTFICEGTECCCISFSENDEVDVDVDVS